MLCRVFSGVMGVGLLTNMAVRILDRGGGSENERRGQARPKGPTDSGMELLETGQLQQHQL